MFEREPARARARCAVAEVRRHFQAPGTPVERVCLPSGPSPFLDRSAGSGFTKVVNLTLFGYPKTGKTTLFNLLTGAHLEVHAYEDGKREPNVRTCPLPDPRLDRVAALFPDKRRIPVSLDITDLVGISFGEVKSSLLLGHLRKADGLVHVVRGFRAAEIPHVRPAVDPAADIRFMEEELVLADLTLVTSRLEKLDKDLKKAKDPEGERELELLMKWAPLLEEGKPVRDFPISPAEEKMVRSFAFLSQKPVWHLVNVDESEAGELLKPGRFAPDDGRTRLLMAFCGRIESEIEALEDERERREFMTAYGLADLSAPRFLGQLLAGLDHITFFTVGKDEVRAWPVRCETPAQKAAGAIHSDLEKGFIRAEVVPWQELVTLGSLPKAKDAGAIRLEGKDYPVRDGDVIYFRFGQ